MNTNFWKDKKVFITGHTGFKGSWLCLWLQKMGAQVTGYALNPPTSPNLFDLACVGNGITSVIGDIRDYEPLCQTVQKVKPEIVIHMAAQPLVRDSYKNPIETYAINVMGTVNLLEAVRNCPGVKSVVNVTTDKCYENKEWIWGYRENEPMGGYDPYSNSKGCSELVTSSFRQSFFNPSNYGSHGVALASARAGNVIGGGDWAADRLIPDCLNSMLVGNPVRIRNSHAIRPWQFVLEPLSGYLQLAEKLYTDGPEFCEGWNFGPEDNDAQPVDVIVKRLCSLWGDSASYTIDSREHPYEAQYLKLDCAKAKSRLVWRPRWDLFKTLDSIVDWYRVYAKKGDIRKVCESQIEDYENS